MCTCNKAAADILTIHVDGGFLIGDWEEWYAWRPVLLPMGWSWMRIVLRRKISLRSGYFIGYIYQEPDN